MLTFSYKAQNPNNGEEVRSVIQAESEQAAAKVLANQGLMPTEIKLQSESNNFFKSRVKAKDKVIFFRQLSTLVGAGLPIAQALRTVSDQVDNKQLIMALTKIVSDVEGGSTLSDAMSLHPDIFSTVMISLVAAGEASGTLDETLYRIADQTEKDAEMMSKVRGALVYPSIVLLVIVGVIIFMLVAVLPQIEVLYEDLDQELPFVTEILLVTANGFMSFWWVILIALASAIFLLKRYMETDKGRETVDVVKMSVPLFGKMFKKLYMARFCRTGSTLLKSGVQMLEMMRITGEAVGNTLIKRDIGKAATKVRAGKALSESLSDSQYILSLVPQMIHIGEESGSIDGMMAKAADFYEKELDDEIKTISTTIEPVLMIVLALVAGVMVGAILLPVYDLVGQNMAI